MPSLSRACGSLALLAALMGTLTPVRAQEAASGGEITVEAPRSLPVPVERNPYSGAAVAVTTVRMSVLYGDLDLTTGRDAERLMERIHNVARDACRQLDRILPLTPDEQCAGKAAANAQALAQATIAAARPAADGAARRP